MTVENMATYELEEYCNWWVEMYSGRRAYPFNMDKGNYRLSDVARGLAHTNRFAGQTRTPYDVASHSLLVAQQVVLDDVMDYMTDEECNAIALYALLHDVSEFLTGDIVAPVKMGLKQLNNGARTALDLTFYDIQHHVERRAGFKMVANTAGKTMLYLSAPGKIVPMGAVDGINELVKEHDLRALVTERRDMFDHAPEVAWEAEKNFPPYQDNACACTDPVGEFMQAARSYYTAALGQDPDDFYR